MIEGGILAINENLIEFMVGLAAPREGVDFLLYIEPIILIVHYRSD